MISCITSLDQSYQIMRGFYREPYLFSSRIKIQHWKTSQLVYKYTKVIRNTSCCNFEVSGD